MKKKNGKEEKKVEKIKIKEQYEEVENGKRERERIKRVNE